MRNALHWAPLVAAIALVGLITSNKAYPQDYKNVPILRNNNPEWRTPKYFILPPVEYDHYYEGDLTIQIVQTLDELRTACGKPTLACAFPFEKSCVIIMVDDVVMRTRGWNTGVVLRHEIGHCNGWPEDHPGQRELPWPTTLIIPRSAAPIPVPEPDKRTKDETKCCGQ